MADPDADTDDEFDDVPDYYSILNLRKDVRFFYIGDFFLSFFIFMSRFYQNIFLRSRAARLSLVINIFS